MMQQQNEMRQYNMPQPTYPSHQPQSAGLSRKPPGFEFMTPKTVQPNYNEYQQPPYMQPPQPHPYYAKQSASPSMPINLGYDVHIKKQPQSATMLDTRFIETKSLLKSKRGNPESTNSIDVAVLDIINRCEQCPDFESKLNQLKGKLEIMLFTQTGSRFIQKQLSDEQEYETHDLTMDNIKAFKSIRQQQISEFTTFILEEIGEKINELMIDRYGNYFFQEFIRKCDDVQRLSILNNIRPNFIQICTDKKGTHTVQRLIDMVNTPAEEKALFECMQGQFVKLCMDQQGTHV
jgi:hypothetical protein